MVFGGCPQPSPVLSLTLLCSLLQLISDAGYQGEITSVSTACQQLEVFSRVLRTSLATLLDGGEDNLEKNLPEFAVSSLEGPSAVPVEVILIDACLVL